MAIHSQWLAGMTLLSCSLGTCCYLMYKRDNNASLTPYPASPAQTNAFAHAGEGWLGTSPCTHVQAGTASLATRQRELLHFDSPRPYLHVRLCV
jgi:hypothetical protein